jgi:glycosyltransferase involved in cell wall biosynthesis
MAAVSIIIPTLNRKEKLRMALLSLYRQTCSPVDFEVIVSDAGSVDDSEIMVLGLEAPFRLLLQKGHHQGAAEARNAGARASSAEILLFLDDEAQATPSLVEEHLKTHGESRNVFVLGAIKPHPGMDILNRRILERSCGVQGNSRLPEGGVIIAHLSLRKEHFYLAGRFDEQNRAWGWEDSAFSFRLLQQRGLRMVFNEEAVALLHSNQNAREAAGKKFYQGKSLVASLRKDPSMLSERRDRTSSSPGFSLSLRKKIMTALEAVETFTPLTIMERDSFISSVIQAEKNLARNKDGETEKSLAENYDWLIDYAHLEGIYAALRRPSITSSIFQDYTPDPSQVMVGVPLIFVSNDLPLSGYGTNTKNFLRELRKRGFRVTHLPSNSDLQVKKEDRARATFDAHSIGLEEDPAAIINFCPPLEFRRDPDYYNIGYTAFETTTLPDSWVTALNAMDEIWVPSSFNKRVFLESGVKAPLKIMPHGVDHRQFYPGAGELPFEFHGCFTFFSVGNTHFYKGIDILLQAYLEEFDSADDVCLFLKTYRYFAPLEASLWEIITEMKKKRRKRDFPLIMLMENTFIERMSSLYSVADAYINTSRGEGFCLPLLEAMACGVPVIAGNFGGQSDFLTKTNAFLLEYRLVDVSENDHPFHRTGQWAEISVEHTRQVMRYVYEHREEAILRSAEARKDFLEKWTLEMASERIAQRLFELPAVHEREPD